MGNAEGLSGAEVEYITQKWADLPEPLAERRMTVRDLTRRGLAPSVIASLLKVKTTTVNSDLQWMKKLAGKYVESYLQEEEIGDSVALFDELENKLVVMAEKMAEPQGDDNLPRNAQQAGSLYMQAVKVRETRLKLLEKVGMLKVVPKKVEVGGKIDVGKLTRDQLPGARRKIEDRIAEITARISRYSSENPLEGADIQWKGGPPSD